MAYGEIIIADKEKKAAEFVLLNDYVSASKIQQEIVTYYKDIFGERSIETIKPIEMLAFLNVAQNKCSEAQELYLTSLKIRKEKLFASVDDRKDIVFILSSLADAYACQNQFTEAISIYDEANQAAKEWFSGGDGDILAKIGVTYAQLKDWNTAIKFYLEAIEACGAIKDLDPVVINVKIANIYKLIAGAYGNLGMSDKVKKYEALAAQTNRQALSSDNTKVSSDSVTIRISADGKSTIINNK